MTADISDVTVTESKITSTEASITLVTNSTFTMITDNDLDLFSTSGGNGVCSVVAQTAQSISVLCTNLNNGTAYSLAINVSIGDNPDVMVIINFQTQSNSR